MLHLLIVDDEIHAVEGVKADLDLEKFDISEVFTAFNIRQAKKIFEENSIDIMLCDIEMPQGNGLELLEWVKEHHPRTESIFLTNHAEFQYAKKAMELGSLGYLLKPIESAELEQFLLKAKERINKQSEIQKSIQLQQLWTKHQPVISERFWLDLLHQKIASDPNVIKETAASLQLPFVEDMRFLPVIISIQRWHKKWKTRDEKILEYALKNAAEEMMIDNTSHGQMIDLSQGRFLVILTFDHNTEESYMQKLKLNCNSYIAFCNQSLYCDLSCYIGKTTYAHHMIDIVDDLNALEKNNVSFSNKVFVLGEEQHAISSVKIPEMNAWSAMLREGLKEKVIQEVRESIIQMVNSEGMDLKLLHQFHQDFMQMIYYVLKLKGIQAHHLFCNPTSEALSAKATRSVMDLLEWIEDIVEKAINQANAIEETNTVIEKVKQYITVNIDQGDLSREDVANHVYLNPDYLSRIFKKETGVSFSEYLLEERIKLAKKLLSDTDMNVSAIASSIGYNNFSHFSKLFKKHTGMNPRQFRQQVRYPIQKS